MNIDTQSKSFKIGKIVAVNLIPIVGILVFGWGIFEVALTYLLETGVIFMIFFIDRFFIDKKHRYPFVFALIQLFFLIFPFAGLIWGYSILIFSVTGPDFERSKHMFVALERRFSEFDFWWVLVSLFLFEIINYVLKNKDGRNHKSSSLWYNLRKLFFVHLFVILVTSIYGALPHNLVTGLFFIIGFKALLDYTIENEQAMSKVDKWFNKFATIGLNEDGTAKKDEE